jgi:hypothetical protein
LRQALWPHAPAAERHQEIEAMRRNSSEITAFIAFDAETAAGLIMSNGAGFTDGLLVYQLNRPQFPRPRSSSPTSPSRPALFLALMPLTTAFAPEFRVNRTSM